MPTIPLPALQVIDVDGYVLGGQVWIFCPHEHRWHRHGRGDLTVGYVAAHCICPVSRFSTTFRITKRGPFTTAVRRSYPRQRRRCATCSASPAAAA